MMVWCIGKRMILLALASMALVACGAVQPITDIRSWSAVTRPSDSNRMTRDRTTSEPEASTSAASIAQPPTLKAELAWAVEGGLGRLHLPVALALDAKGHLYVVDGGSQRIQVFDREGRFITMWGDEGAAAGQFRFRIPERCLESDPNHCGVEVGGGVAVDGQGRVYVADWGNHRVQVFDGRGGLLGGWGGEGRGVGQFRLPMGIAADGRGRVYVSDAGNHRIQVFDQAGRFLTQWGGLGMEAGRFMDPGALAVDAQGNLMVVEPSIGRMQQFDGQGRFLRQWLAGGPGGATQQGSAVAMDGYGHLYITSAAGRVKKLGDVGQVLATWGGGGPWDIALRWPVGIAIDEDRAVYIADRDAGCLLMVKQLLPTTS